MPRLEVSVCYLVSLAVACSFLSNLLKLSLRTATEHSVGMASRDSPLRLGSRELALSVVVAISLSDRFPNPSAKEMLRLPLNTFLKGHLLGALFTW